MAYAEATLVSVEKSRMEIEATLRRYKADGFYYGQDGRLVILGFRIAERQVRFRLEMPDPKRPGSPSIRVGFARPRGPRRSGNRLAGRSGARSRW